MANSLDQYTRGSADWRKTIKQNNQRTYVVIFLFVLIYALIGVLVDLYIYSGSHPDIPLSTIFIGLFQLQFFPVATLVMMGVALVSILVTFTLHNKLMLLGTEYHEVTPNTARNLREQQLYNIIEEMKIASALKYMPKVFVIDADYMNAFASGYSEKSAMVAITRGLLEKLNRDELEAVMAHELSHIRHLDIKITLTATLLANLIVIVLDLAFRNALYTGNRNGRRNVLFMIIMLLRFLLPVVSMVLLLYLSRKRELMADAGAVELTRNNEPLARALIKIQEDHTANTDTYKKAYEQTPHENLRRQAYIFDPSEAGVASFTSLADILSTHPSLKERLAALGFIAKKNAK